MSAPVGFGTPFTGRGGRSAGVRVSYQWCTIADVVGGVVGQPVGIMNGEMSINESSSHQTFSTTAFNGFRFSLSGTAAVSGTIDGFIQSAEFSTKPSGRILQPVTNKMYYLDIGAGSMRYSGYALIDKLDFAMSVNDVCSCRFNFIFTGIPDISAFAFVTGMEAPL